VNERNDILTAAILHMILHANMLDVRGTAHIVVTQDFLWFDQKTYSNRIARDPDPSRGQDDVGTNYYGFSDGKISRMVRIVSNQILDESALPVAKGENDKRGCVYEQIHNYHVFASFSGGTEDQDVEIAKEGLLAIKKHQSS